MKIMFPKIGHWSLDIGHSRKGSILIWTVMLGVVLTSVFFFFAMRLRMNSATQRDTIVYQDQKAYLDSYVGYLMAHPSETTINFDDITGSLTQKTFEITGLLDSGAEIPYAITDAVTVKWNTCGQETGNLLVNDSIEKLHVANPTCSEYEDQVSLPAGTSLKLKSLDSPFHYSISSTALLTDTKWHLKASIPLEYGKTIDVERTF